MPELVAGGPKFYSNSETKHSRLQPQETASRIRCCMVEIELSMRSGVYWIITEALLEPVIYTP